MNQSAPFAEVMYSSLHTLRAECWRWDTPPVFGQLICVPDGEYTTYAIVTNIATGPREGHRSPVPLEKTYEELQREYPHIFHLMCTSFTCVVIGYRTHDTIIHQAPAVPARIHAWVTPAPYEAYTQALASETYLPLVFHAPELDASIDELILAIMRQMAAVGALSRSQIERTIDTFSMLINNDYRRLKLVLQRLEQLCRTYHI